MKVYELINKLCQMPAGANVYVEGKKSLDELLEGDFSGNRSAITVSFKVKVVGGKGEEVYLIFQCGGGGDHG